MTQTIVFSMNRAAQLDLLIRSIKTRAHGFLDPVHVIYTATDDDFFRAYDTCARQHPDVLFHQQHNLPQDVNDRLLYGASDTVTFLCDDDLITRPFTDYPHPHTILARNEDVLCVSLRLGLNTTYCYPLNQEQKTPEFEELHDALLWKWRTSLADWGYPMSLDGHVFRRNLLLGLLSTLDYENPNRLEQHLAQKVHMTHLPPMMACYHASLVTGVPVNRVQGTHPNRNAEHHPRAAEMLNSRYLNGQRLNLGSIKPEMINAAHVEIPLVFA